jgi:hypothetical protein
MRGAAGCAIAMLTNRNIMANTHTPRAAFIKVAFISMSSCVRSVDAGMSAKSIGLGCIMRTKIS